MTSLRIVPLALAVVCFACLTTAQSDCPSPVAPADGTVSATALTNGSMATYACNEGFDLVGVTSVTCMAGNWSAEAPTCTASTTEGPAEGGDAMTTMMPPAGEDGTTVMAGGDDGDDDDNDGDNMGDNEPQDQDMHDEDDEDDGGLRPDQQALIVLSTFLICGAIGVFLGLCYWKHKGTSYVTVTTETTFNH